MRHGVYPGFLLACLSVAGAADLPQIPLNLDFRDGKPDQAPPGWKLAGSGYAVEQRETCACAVILPPATPNPAAADLTQIVSGTLLRGTVVYLKASLRVEAPGRAQLWMRVNRHGQPAGLFDNLTDRPVQPTPTGWTRSEIRLPVSTDADSIEFGVTSSGGGQVWIRDVSLEVPSEIPDELEPIGPVNLGFTRGEPGHAPLFWTVDPARSGTRAASVLNTGCKTGTACVEVTAPYSISQTFGAPAWRSKVVRLRALLRVQGETPDSTARIWLRTRTSQVQRTAYRDVSGPDWAEVTVVHQIEQDALKLSLGITALGSAKVTVDGVYFDVVPEAEALPDKTVPASLLPDMPVEAPASSSEKTSRSVPVATPAPPLEEQRRVVNLAAARAAAYTAGLPNFVCTEVIARSEKRGNQRWLTRDVLTVQLGYSDAQEHYKLIAVNNRPTRSSYLSLGGALSQGEFGSIVREMFRPQTAKFGWARQETVRIRSVDVFSYQIAKEKSDYMIQLGANRSGVRSAVVAHHGFIYIDPLTGDVLRIVRIAEPPAGFPVQHADTTLDYDFSDVGGHSYLLPLRADIELGTSTMRTRNEVQFRDYRKFEANSTIWFDDKP